MSAAYLIPAVRKLLERTFSAAGSDAPAFTDDQILVALADAPEQKPAKVGRDFALAGRDGAKASQLLAKSQAAGVAVLSAICHEAFAHYVNAVDAGFSPRRLFADFQTRQLADALAATNATADLLGRSRIREKHARAGILRLSDEQPFEAFKDLSFSLLPPQEAIAYFQSLVPTLGNDPGFAAFHERTAFTLAKATEEVLLRKVQSVVLEALKSGASADVAAFDIGELLDRAGVSVTNPQYADMVFRTNALDAYNSGSMREMRDPDVVDDFPWWVYLAVVDDRSRWTHAARDGNYYPNSVDFFEVRGLGPEDACNCRCTFAPVFRAEVDDLKASGVRAQPGW